MSLTGAGQVGPQRRVLRATVDPNGGRDPLSLRVRQHRRSFGSSTPERRRRRRPTAAWPITEPLGRLRPYTRYYYRLTATNAAGTTTSSTRTFMTARLPTAITLEVDRPSTPWGEPIEVFGA